MSSVADVFNRKQHDKQLEVLKKRWDNVRDKYHDEVTDGDALSRPVQAEMETLKEEHHKMRELLHLILISDCDNMIGLREEGQTVTSMVNTQEAVNELMTQDLEEVKCPECGDWDITGYADDDGTCENCQEPIDDRDEPSDLEISDHDNAELYSEC